MAKKRNTPNSSDILIAGGGIAGMAAALAIIARNPHISVTVLDAAPQGQSAPDGRAYAIAQSSFKMLEHLGVAARLSGHFQPMNDILISDGEAGQTPSPLTLHFDSAQLRGEDGLSGPMGYFIESAHLSAALTAQINESSAITWRAGVKVTGHKIEGEAVLVSTDSAGDFTAKLLIAADGAGSPARRRAGIDVITTAYNQMGIVTTVTHELPHEGVAHELFLPSGPLALLPLPDDENGNHRSSIVWTEKTRAAKAAMALPDDLFEAELARRFGDHWGVMKVCAQNGVMSRRAWPLHLQMAKAYHAPRLALLGDAAHVIHPIAGQGLNMGLRDAAALADVIADAHAEGRDIGGDIALTDYGQWRNFDNQGLALSTDLLNRLFSNTISPLKHLRRLGIAAVDKAAPARSFFMREAAGQTGERPVLLR